MKTGLVKITITALVMMILLTNVGFSKELSRIVVSEHKIYWENNEYALAKYEPETGVYIGAYVLQAGHINNSMSTFNEIANKKHASFFKYVGYGMPAPTKWLQEMDKAGAVPNIAFEPNQGLDEVVDNDYIRTFAKELGKYEKPIFLRWASEMNGNWAAYSKNSVAYIEKWRLIHDIMQEEAPNVAMVWTVFTNPQSTILKFYPGDDYVDWVGVNVYNVLFHNGDFNLPCEQEDPIELMAYVYNQFSYRKPIQISEFGVSNYTIVTDQHYDEFATAKLERLYSSLATLYPRVKSVYYFDVNNIDQPNPARRVNNYSISQKSNIMEHYMNLIASDYFLSDVVSLENEVQPITSKLQDEVYNVNYSNYISLLDAKKLTTQDTVFETILIKNMQYVKLRDLLTCGYKIKTSENDIILYKVK